MIAPIKAIKKLPQLIGSLEFSPPRPNIEARKSSEYRPYQADNNIAYQTIPAALHYLSGDEARE